MKTLALFLILFSQGIEAFPRRSQKPTIIEKPMNLTYNVMKLRTAMNTSNQAMLIRILCDKTFAQRMQIKNKYWDLYKEKVKWEFFDGLGGFGQLFDMLFTDWISHRVKTLHKSLENYKAYETDGNYVEIILSNGQNGTEAMRQRYFEETNEKMEYISKWPYRNAFEDPFLEGLVGRTRSENVSLEDAIKDAQSLYNSPLNKLKRWKVFVDIFTSRNLAQLDLMYDEFQRLYGVGLEHVILKSFPRGRLLGILRMARNSGSYYAPLIKDTMDRLGTNTWALSYYIVTRAEVDLASIRDEWEATEQESLYDWIIDDTSGYYREALLAILDGNTRD